MKNERIISLKGLLVYILEHWRSIIIGIIVGAVILGLFGVYRSHHPKPAASKFDVDAAMEEILEEEAAQDALPMTETERTAVRSAAINMQNYYESLDYVAVSPFMAFDGTQVYYTTISGAITPSDSESNAAICYACRQLMNGGGVHQYINDKLGMDIINWDRIIVFSDNINNNSASSADGVFQLSAYYSDEETCRKISECMISYLNDNLASLHEQFGEFELKFVNNGIEKIYSNTILNAQRDRKNTTQSYYDNAVSLIQNFSQKQLDYYIEMLKDFKHDTSDQDELIERAKDYIQLQKETARQTALEKAMKDAGVTEEDLEKASQPVKVSVKRYILIGILLGAFIMICFYGVVYIFANRTDLYDDAKTLYGVSDLGQIPNDTVKKRPLNFVDRWIRRFRNRTYKRSTKDAVTMCAADIRMLSEKAGIDKLAYVTCSGEFTSADGSDEILESFKSGVPGSEILDNILDDPDSLNRIKDMNGIVLMSKSGKTSRNNIRRAVELMNRQGVTLLGNVTVG